MSAHELHTEKVRTSSAARELSEVIGKIVSLLRFEASDVYEICRKSFEGTGILDYSEFESIDGGDFPLRWLTACQNIDIDDESRRIFEAVGRVLGSCDLNTQTDRLSRLQAELSDHAKDLREKADSTKKLYTTLGAAFGIALSIIII